MRIVCLEEHFTIPELSQTIDTDALSRRGWPLPGSPRAAQMPEAQLSNTGPSRLADMDGAGITVQILSLAGPGADLLDPARGAALARQFNDRLAEIVRAHPERYAGFSHLPMNSPQVAADELERTVKEFGFKGALINGVTGGRFLDDPSFEPLLARAQALDVPVYIHPNLPPPEVYEAYYGGLPHDAGWMLSRAGWGWHSEVAVHVLRMVLAGTFDKYPKLKIIIGHMGEGLPAMLDRCDSVFGKSSQKYLSRPVSQTILDQVWITTSGFFSMTPFTAAITKFGADRILFSVDYPFSSNAAGRAFLDSLPISEPDRQKIAHRNADALLRLETV